MNSDRARPLLEASIAACGMILFALFVRSGLPWRLISDAGLALTALVVLWSLRREGAPARVLGLTPFGGPAALLSIPGIALGIGLGLYFRWQSGLPPVLGRLKEFALVAGAIGGVEELLYRGYLQGRLNRVHWALGVVGASAAHAMYKTALFVLAPADRPVNLGFLLLWTFLGGLVFGLLRQAARNVAPAFAAHVAFDVAAYGDRIAAPWWVWG